ncbi:MAG: T9SS type A sorting domain-containing protein [Lewinellaceae bacterium]|nr:T9SS type A sorting domain-containing protein [Lewinellaceae bacterium]
MPWGFPEKIELSGVNGDIEGQDFKGVKLGDVVSTWANPANFGGGQPLVLRVEDRVLEAGSEVIAEFRADQLDDLSSFQFALYFDPEQLQLLDIEPLTELPMSADNFGTYHVSDGEIRVVWAQAQPLALNESAAIFRLRFQTLESGGKLSDALQLDEEALPARTYNSVYAESDVKLQYSTLTAAGEVENKPGLSLENLPNPFVDVTTLQFVLPQAGPVELRISDLSGRLLFSQTQHYTAGRHEETVRLEGISGVLFAELSTEQGRVVRKMLAVQN